MMQRVVINVRWISIIAVMIGIVYGMVAAAPPVSFAQDDASWLLAQINDLRAGLGLHAYSLNGQLSAAATQHSQYMVATCDVSHAESNGSTPTSRARANGYTGNWISENIYMGGSGSDAWSFWLNSGLHYQGMTHSIVNEIGIGVAYGACGQGFTLLFGHRGDVSVPPAPPPPADTGDDLAPPATRYVPPPPTLTPTPTVPTLTPSHTWTITPTHTPSPTHTPTAPATATATGTPLILPTVPALPSATAVAVAQIPTATPLPPTLQPTVTRTPAIPDHDSGSDGDSGRTLLFVLLLGGAVILGGAGLTLLWRLRSA